MNKTKNTYPEIKIGNLYKMQNSLHLKDLSGARKKIDKNSIITLVGLERYPKYKRDGFFTFKILVDNSIRLIDMVTKYEFINGYVKIIKNKNLEPKK